MFVIHVGRFEQLPTRVVIGCDAFVSGIVDTIKAHGLDCNVEETATVPERSDAEKRRADHLMQCLYGAAGRA